MRAIVPMLIVLVGVWAHVALAQGASSPTSSVYDQQYVGPVDRYGRPTYEVPPWSRQPQPQGQDAMFPMAFQGAGGIGSYLWSFLPAPVRGVEPYQPPPRPGQVFINFVPPSR